MACRLAICAWFVPVALLACGGAGPDAATAPCAPEDPGAAVAVAGIFRYEGASPFLLRGTITFEQSGDTVRVTSVTYENSADRPLVGEGTLSGNRLDIELVPENGDPDYHALVTFLFGDGGSTFCVGFADSNGDAGTQGTYTGARVDR